MVSIIMGVYNGEKTLCEALNSIIEQTYKDWEFIICNDCSTDNTAKILNDYAAKDSRFLIIENDINRGLAASLNNCLQYVHGEYIARMDCDDISISNRFERQVSFLDNHLEYQLVGTFMQSFNELGRQNVIETKQYPTKYDLPKGAPFSHATIMIRTQAMLQLNGYFISKHTIRTEDVDLWYRFFAEDFQGANIPEVLYLVRMDEAAYKRRKLKYMMHASYIIWYGCDMVRLPAKYKVYCLKPILSWIFPAKLKKRLRKWIIKG